MKLLLNKITYLIISTFVVITLFNQPILALENNYPSTLNGSSSAPMKNSYFNKSTFEYIVRPIEEIDNTVVQYNGSNSFIIGDYFDSEYLHKWSPNITENTTFINIVNYTDDQYTLNDLHVVLNKFKLAFDNYNYIYTNRGRNLIDSDNYPFDADLPSNTTVNRLAASDRELSMHHYLVYFENDISSGNDFLNEIYTVCFTDLSYTTIFDADQTIEIDGKQYLKKSFNSSASGLCRNQGILFTYNATTDTCAFNPLFLQEHVYPFLTYEPSLGTNSESPSYSHTNSFKTWPKKQEILDKWTYEGPKIYTSKQYFLSQNILQVFEVSYSSTGNLAMFGTSRVIGIWDDNVETYQYNVTDDYPMFNFGPMNFDPLYQSSYTLTVSTNNSEYGVVQGGGTFESGSTTTIKAIPNSNAYRFVEWSDHITEAEREIFVNADYDLQAIFATKDVYSIILNSEPEISGHFEGDGDHYDGDTVEVEAIPYKGYSFSHWSDGNEDQKRNLLVSDNIELTAYFTEGGLSGKIDAGPIICIIMICAFLMMLKGF